MFVSGHDFGFMKRFAHAFIALAFIVANIAPAYAQGLAGGAYLQRGATTYAGPAAMLGVRIPFGGKGTTSSQPMIGLSLGSSWQAAPGSTLPRAHNFISTVEAGLSFRGDPILRLSSFEALDRLRASAEAAQSETFCGRNLTVCILGGVAIVAVIVAIAAGSDDCEPSDLYPPGQDPCMCFEADGCKD